MQLYSYNLNFGLSIKVSATTRQKVFRIYTNIGENFAGHKKRRGREERE